MTLGKVSELQFHPYTRDNDAYGIGLAQISYRTRKIQCFVSTKPPYKREMPLDRLLLQRVCSLLCPHLSWCCPPSCLSRSSSGRLCLVLSILPHLFPRHQGTSPRVPGTVTNHPSPSHQAQGMGTWTTFHRVDLKSV